MSTLSGNQQKPTQDKLVTLGRQKDCLQELDLNVLAFPCLFAFNIYLSAVVTTC